MSRSIKKGPFVAPELIKRVEEMNKTGEKNERQLVVDHGGLLRSEKDKQNGQTDGGQHGERKPAAGREKIFQKRHSDLGGLAPPGQSRREGDSPGLAHSKAPGMATMSCRGLTVRKRRNLCTLFHCSKTKFSIMRLTSREETRFGPSFRTLSFPRSM